jgi:uncharacterized membrane protein
LQFLHSRDGHCNASAPRDGSDGLVPKAVRIVRADMPLGVTSFEISLFIHITAAVVGLGVTFAESFTYPVAMRLGLRYLPFKHRFQLAINVFLAFPALVVVLATGLYQVSEFDYELGAFWLSGTMAIVVVLALMLGAYFIPEDRRLEAMVRRDIEASGDGEIVLSDEYLRRVRWEAALGTVADLLVIAAIYLMITKPGL